MNLGHKLAELVGYDLIKTRKNILLHRHLHNLLALLRTDCVIDVGANHGQYGLMLRDLGYRGRIVSFEPVSSSYQKLTASAAQDPKWETFNFALGAREEELSINVTTASDFASFLPPSDFSQRVFGDVVAISRREKVLVKRLDDIFDPIIRKATSPTIHLKLDTQGYDLEVLKGATGVLPQITSLQSELSIQPVYEGAPNFLESLTVFRDSGFTVTGLFPVSFEQETLALVELDCVCRRIPQGKVKVESRMTGPGPTQGSHLHDFDATLQDSPSCLTIPV